MFSKDELMRHPADVFKEPLRVLEHPELSAQQKEAILTQWKDEVVQRQKAEEENMDDGGSVAELLQEIQNALERIKPDG